MTLKHTDNDWPEVCWNIVKARAVWRRLVKLLQKEGADNRFSDLFYREVIQAVLLLGLESWDLLYAMIRAVEGTHMGFLCHITGKGVRRQTDGAWETPADEEFLREVGIQSSAKYIVCRKATVVQWVALQPIL